MGLCSVSSSRYWCHHSFETIKSSFLLRSTIKSCALSSNYNYPLTMSKRTRHKLVNLDLHSASAEDVTNVRRASDITAERDVVQPSGPIPTAQNMHSNDTLNTPLCRILFYYLLVMTYTNISISYEVIVLWMRLAPDSSPPFFGMVS